MVHNIEDAIEDAIKDTNKDNVEKVEERHFRRS